MGADVCDDSMRRKLFFFDEGLHGAKSIRSLVKYGLKVGAWAGIGMHFDRRVFCAFGGSILGFWYRKSQKGKKNGGGLWGG